MTTQNQLLREALRDAVTLFACRCTDSTARNWFERAQAAIAAQPAEPLSPLLVRDVAEMIGSTVPDVCKALVQLGHGQRSTNAAVHPEEAIAVAKLLAQPAEGGEPYYGHQFKEIRKGVWLCKCGKQITEGTTSCTNGTPNTSTQQQTADAVNATLTHADSCCAPRAQGWSIRVGSSQSDTPPASQPGAAMSASAQMQFLGEDDGVRWYWAEPGLFQKPGVYYWNGSENVHVGKEANHSQAQQPSVTVRYDLSPAMVEGAIRDRLIAMGWTPPLQQPKPQQSSGEWFCGNCRVPVPAPQPAKQPMPEGWVRLTIDHETGYPEEVAFGHPRMMDRLKKWLDRYFEMLQAPITDEQRAIDYYSAAAEQRQPNWVPSRVFLKAPVKGDFPIGHNTIAQAGVHECDSNIWGAVSVIASNGERLGIKPAEFRPVAWRANTTADQANGGTQP